jgi:hypothetical protein
LARDQGGQVIAKEVLEVVLDTVVFEQGIIHIDQRACPSLAPAGGGMG